MEECEKAYLAGIIDGEGTVTLMSHHRNETPAPYVSISNCNLQLLHWAKKKVGGGVITRKSKKKPHHREAYTLVVRFDKAIDLLRDIKDYLIVKKRQADLIICKYKSVTHRNGRYSTENLRRKMQLVSRIRRLNQR